MNKCYRRAGARPLRSHDVCDAHDVCDVVTVPRTARGSLGTGGFRNSAGPLVAAAASPVTATAPPTQTRADFFA
jgi:hypothetical protein